MSTTTWCRATELVRLHFRQMLEEYDFVLRLVVDEIVGQRPHDEQPEPARPKAFLGSNARIRERIGRKLPDSRVRKLIEAELRDRVRVAERAFREASAQHARMKQKYRGQARPEAQSLIDEAANLERVALLRYGAALRHLADFLFHGRAPDNSAE